MTKQRIGFLIGGLVLLFFLWIFSSLPQGTNHSLDELSGVILAAPPDYNIISLPGEVTALDAAKALEKAYRDFPFEQKIGLKYEQNGNTNFLLLNRQASTIQQLATNTYGTVVQTTWRGAIDQRLQSGLSNGDFTPEGFSPPEEKNLYH